MRKHLFFLSLILVMASCSTKYAMIKESSIIDYSSFEKNGFFLSEANSVSFDYRAVGSVSATVLNGWEVKGVAKDNRQNAVTSMGEQIKYGLYKNATPNDVLDELYKKAIENGANGIINLSIKPTTETIPGRGMIKGYYATGMAIKK